MTAIVSTVLLFSSNAANVDYSDNELDISGTKGLYEHYSIKEYYEYNMYIIYYRSMYLAQTLGLSFKMWWVIMSIIAMSVVYYACKIHRYNYNLFLATFLAYYEFIFYSGFKFFYGFCFFLLAFGFLLRNTPKGRFAFAVLNLIATGFHVMYFLFFFFLIKPIKRPQFVVKIVVIVSILLTVLARSKGSAILSLVPMIHTKGGELSGTLADTELTVTQLGFYLPVFIHSVTLYIAFRVRKFLIKENKLTNAFDTLYYMVLISLIFCPLYNIGMTFMRYITAFSFVVILACSIVLNDTSKSRRFCFKMSMLLLLSFYCVRIVSGAQGFYKYLIGPFFDVL